MEVCLRSALLAFILATFNIAALSSDPVMTRQSKVISKRHTPFLPGDYWKDKRPEFGDTQTEVQVMVNGTARLKCPISHVADTSVSFFRQISLLFCSFPVVETNAA